MISEGKARLSSLQGFQVTTPVSFESLSRQLISCAISAAMSMKQNERPDLQTIVTNGLRMSIAAVAETRNVVGADTTADVDAEISTTTMM
mmetsp:Transcript_7501/g.20268  ORF Transcript_7501/g.20268 Transcript_7501/m.20268 type:complete len:90 (-) Transcript_7501:1140-1409(-)